MGAGELGIYGGSNSQSRIWEGSALQSSMSRRHVCSLADVKNAAKYAETQKLLTKFQNAIDDFQMSFHDSVILHPKGIFILLALR